MLFDAVLERQQGVEGAVPALQLEGLDEAAALGVAGEAGAQPVGEAVFGGGGGEAAGDQDEEAVGEGLAEIEPEGAQGEERTEAEGMQGDGVGGAGGFVAAAEFVEAVEEGFELVLAAESGNDAAGGAAIFPDGFAEAYIFVGAAAGAVGCVRLSV